MEYIGCHVSFSQHQLLGCAKQAISYGANCFMFYTGAPQNTIRKEIDLELTKKAWEYMRENNISLEHVIVHAPYIINLANKSSLEKWLFGIEFLKQELNRCVELKIKKIVLHPGNAIGISKLEGIKNIIEALTMIKDCSIPVEILLETMSGKGTECGSNLLEISEILKGVDSKNFGCCIDTCHLNDSGYDMKDFDNFLIQFDECIGLKYLKCIHLNDSKNSLGARKDRHENVGFGTLGFDVLSNILFLDKLKDVPKILETPFVGRYETPEKREYPPYGFEIAMLKSKKFNPLLIENIRNFYKNDL